MVPLMFTVVRVDVHCGEGYRWQAACNKQAQQRKMAQIAINGRCLAFRLWQTQSC